ncbi:hypothetical protein ADEAN_000130200 [Angomonas deanei]|uniref:Uncharacterized protein n=1 Tax=Angomonas deanei TaxID=59799 RepID=A0A7G2C2I3_9TRYP|nr:hypothetical protein ADEAN_000130200 [Angomonas deanei]
MGLIPSRESCQDGTAELPFISRAAMDYTYDGEDDTNPSLFKRGKNDEVYYYEYRVVPLTRGIFPSEDSVLFRQLWQARRRQNPRYHFQLQDTWSPGALLDPAAFFYDREELLLKSKLDILEGSRTGKNGTTEGPITEEQYQELKKTLSDRLEEVRQKTAEVPYNSPSAFYDLLVNRTEENVLFDTNADLSAYAKELKEGDGEAKPVRPVPAAVVLVRVKMSGEEYNKIHFAASTQRHHPNKGNSQPPTVRKKRQALLQELRPLRVTVQDVQTASEKVKEEAAGWLKLQLSQETKYTTEAELRVVGMFGLMSVAEVLAGSLFLPGEPSASLAAERAALLARAEPHGLPSDTLIPVTFFEKSVGDKEMCHTFFALLRAYARSLKMLLCPEAPVQEDQGGAAEQPDPPHAPWQQWTERLAKSGARWSLGIPVRLSNIPLTQLCRQIRLLLEELHPVYPKGKCLSDFQDSQRVRNMATLEAKRREKEKGSAPASPHAPPVPPPRKETPPPKGKPVLNAEAITAGGGTYKNAPQSLVPADNGLLCYGDQGLVVLYVHSDVVSRALCQVAYMPLSNSVEALGVTLTASAPPALTYRGEVRLPEEGATTPIRSGWMSTEEKMVEDFYTTALRLKEEPNFPVVRLVDGKAVPRVPNVMAVDLPPSQLGVVQRPLAEQQRGNLLPLCTATTLAKMAEEVFGVGEEWHGRTLQQLVDAVASSRCRGDQTPDSVLGFSPLAKRQRQQERQEGEAPAPDTTATEVMVQLTNEPARVLRRGDLIRFCPTADGDGSVSGYWYVDDALHAEDVILSWMRKVGGRARETRVSEIKWVRYDDNGEDPMKGFLKELQPEATAEELENESAVYNIARVERFRQWRFTSDGYIYFHGVTVRLPGLFSYYNQGGEPGRRDSSTSVTHIKTNTISKLNNQAAAGRESSPIKVERVVARTSDLPPATSHHLYRATHAASGVLYGNEISSESGDSRRSSSREPSGGQASKPPARQPASGGIHIDFPPGQQPSRYADPNPFYYGPPKTKLTVPLPRSVQQQLQQQSGKFYTMDGQQTSPPPASRYTPPQQQSAAYADPSYLYNRIPQPPPQLPTVYPTAVAYGPPPPQGPPVLYQDPYGQPLYYAPGYYAEGAPYTMAAPAPYSQHPSQGGSPYLNTSGSQRQRQEYYYDSERLQDGYYTSDNSAPEIPMSSQFFEHHPSSHAGHTPPPARPVEIASAVADGSSIRVRVLSKQRIQADSAVDLPRTHSSKRTMTHDPYSLRDITENATITRSQGQSFTGGLDRSPSAANEFYADGASTRTPLYGNDSDRFSQLARHDQPEEVTRSMYQQYSPTMDDPYSSQHQQPQNNNKVIVITRSKTTFTRWDHHRLKER